MRLSKLANYKFLCQPLPAFIVGGFIGVLVDIDHPIGKIFGWQERQLHIFLLVLVIGVGIYCSTHIRRYFSQ
jgi:hypothetical protein